MSAGTSHGRPPAPYRRLARRLGLRPGTQSPGG